MFSIPPNTALATHYHLIVTHASDDEDGLFVAERWLYASDDMVLDGDEWGFYLLESVMIGTEAMSELVSIESEFDIDALEWSCHEHGPLDEVSPN